MESIRSGFTVDVRRLRVLRELQRCGTVGATAQSLALTPSAISQQISALAREVGAPLLAPQGRRVRLTPQAELLLEHAAAIDAQLERARADLAAFEDGQVGRVAIGAFATAINGVVLPALTRLRKERPRLELRVRETGADAVSRLDHGEYDVIVTVDHSGGLPRGDGRYVRWELLDDPMLLALPARHPVAARPEVDLLALAEERWIQGGIGGPCREVAQAACATAGFSPRLDHSVDDWSALLALVVAGCGVGLVPALAVGSGPPDGVVLRPLLGPQRAVRHLYAAARAGTERSPTIAPVVAAMLAVARELEATLALRTVSHGRKRAAPGEKRRR